MNTYGYLRYKGSIQTICFEDGLTITKHKIEALLELEKQLNELIENPLIVPMDIKGDLTGFLKSITRSHEERWENLNVIYKEFKEKCEEK